MLFVVFGHPRLQCFLNLHFILDGDIFTYQAQKFIHEQGKHCNNICGYSFQIALCMVPSHSTRVPGKPVFMARSNFRQSLLALKYTFSVDTCPYCQQRNHAGNELDKSTLLPGTISNDLLTLRSAGGRGKGIFFHHVVRVIALLGLP